MSKIPNHISNALLKRKGAGNLRILPKSSSLIDFSSNDYLGLANNPLLTQSISDRFSNTTFGQKNGSTGSRLISGNYSYYQELEVGLANIFQTEAVLLFNSGYAANLGVLSAIPQKGDTVLYDELSHACIKDGIRLSFADRFSFKHNDLEDLEKKIIKAKGEIYVVVESIYSMDGDEAPLKDLVNMCNKHNAHIIVDEAHSTGIVGANGSGLVSSLGLGDQVFIRIHTFGKAMGIHGACVAASTVVKEFLVNFSRPFIYTTGMPLHELISIQCAFEFLKNNIQLQDILATKISLFRNELRKVGLIDRSIDSKSAIQALLYQGNSNVREVAGKLQEKGFNVKPILSPTVKVGQERLRICLHSFNADADIENLTKEIALLGR